MKGIEIKTRVQKYHEEDGVKFYQISFKAQKGNDLLKSQKKIKIMKNKDGYHYTFNGEADLLDCKNLKQVRAWAEKRFIDEN